MIDFNIANKSYSLEGEGSCEVTFPYFLLITIQIMVLALQKYKKNRNI